MVTFYLHHICIWNIIQSKPRWSVCNLRSVRGVEAGRLVLGRVVRIRDEVNIFVLTQKLDKCHSFPTGAAGRYFISYVILTKKATQTIPATGTPGNVDLMTVCTKVQSRVCM